MSPASYLTAPPRVAGRSIARVAMAHVLQDWGELGEGEEVPENDA
jgi:hypothetical protein